MLPLTLEKQHPPPSPERGLQPHDDDGHNIANTCPISIGILSHDLNQSHKLYTVQYDLHIKACQIPLK